MMDDDQRRRAAECEACAFMAEGWGGPGCCEICDRYSIPHTCQEATP